MSARRTCIYCPLPRQRVRRGRRVLELPTCSAHVELLAVDPLYGLADTLARGSYPALKLADRTPGPSRRESLR